MRLGTKSWRRWRRRRLRGRLRASADSDAGPTFGHQLQGCSQSYPVTLKDNHMKSSRYFQTLTFVLVVFLAVSVLAQQPAPTAAPSIPSTGFAGLDQYRARRIAVFTDDFGQLGRYREANAALKPPAPSESSVVFFGDSITDIWHLDEYFPGKPYINRGIGGQTSPQMLVRFRQDVIDLQPKVVVILAGTNDLAGNTGPMTLEQTEANIASMADLATANHIKVVVCSVLPAYDFPWHPGLEPAPKVLPLNAWLRGYAAAKDYVYVDYHSAMKDQRNGLPENLSKDGVHPNPAGYAVMAPLLEAGIAKALGQ